MANDDKSTIDAEMKAVERKIIDDPMLEIDGPAILQDLDILIKLWNGWTSESIKILLKNPAINKDQAHQLEELSESMRKRLGAMWTYLDGLFLKKYGVHYEDYSEWEDKDDADREDWQPRDGT